MSDIITESGLSAGAIYSYFPSKSELVRAVAAEVIGPDGRPFENELDASGRPLHPMDFARQLVVTSMGKLSDPSIVIQVWGEAATDPSVRDLLGEVYDQLLTTCQLQIELWLTGQFGSSAAEVASRAAELAPVMVGIIQGCVVQASLVPGFDAVTYMTAAKALFGAWA
jgi:AcrR family transcriptional regulator